MAIDYSALMDAVKTATAAPKNTVSTSKTSTYNGVRPANYTPKEGYVDKYNQDFVNLANKGQAYMTGGTYIPGKTTYDVNFWSTAGGGGKNQLMGNYDKNYKATGWTYDNVAALQNYVQQYEAAQAQAQLEALYAPIQQMYENMYAAQQQQYAANQEAIRQRTQATIDSINSNKEGINNEYEKAAKENYINSVLQKNQTNDYMQAMGYNGGMTETSLAGINSNYENNRANAILERDSALREIERLVAEAQASGNSDLAEAANNYYNNYISAMQNQAQMNYQIAQDQQAQANADRDYQLQLDQIAWNKQQYNDERADAANQAAEQSKQQIAANDFEAFLNTYQGKYNKQATYEKWIENLKKMDDPYGYNKAKIAYLTQYINSGMGKSTGSSGGSGGVRSSGSSVKNSSGSVNSRGGGNSTVTPNSATSYSYNTLKNNMTNALLKGASKEQLKNFVNPIEAAYNSGTITEAEARELLKMLGA